MEKLADQRNFHYNNSFRNNPIELKNFTLIQIGESSLKAGSFIAPHNQVCFEISFIVSGKGTFRTDNNELEVKTGDVIVTPNKGEHSIYADKDDILFYTFVGFNFKSSASDSPIMNTDIFGDKETCAKSVCDLYGYYRRFMDEFYFIEKPHRHEGVNKIITEALLTEIIVWTERSIRNVNNKANYVNFSSGSNDIVSKIKSFIDLNILEKINIGYIADSLGYSRHYISHLFKNKTETTLQQYIITEKVKKAKELLLLDRFSIRDISDKMNFSTIQEFSRFFKRETGTTPSEFIKQNSQTL